MPKAEGKRRTWPRLRIVAIAGIGHDGAITLESMNHVDVDIAGGLAVWRPVADNPDDVIGVGPQARKAG